MPADTKTYISPLPHPELAATVNGHGDFREQRGEIKADQEWIIRQLVGYTIAEIKSQTAV